MQLSFVQSGEHFLGDSECDMGCHMTSQAVPGMNSPSTAVITGE